MSSEIAIKLVGVGKNYHIYDKPQHRLLQMFAGNKKTYYRDFWAVKDISFTIHKGETVGIIGRNGSGKSTLLQMICGTLTPTTGTIEVNGRVAALLELGAGFNPEFTGRENVYMNAAMYGLSRADVDARLPAILAFADISDFIDQPVKTYSSGMYVRLAFAVIAHVDADILVIDEALAVGDIVFTQKCMRFLRYFMQTGTVLFVSHDTNSVKNLCNRVIWLDSGNLIQDSHPKEVCEHYLEACYAIEQEQSNIARFKAEPNLTQTVSKYTNSPSNEFGTGKAQIITVQLTDESGNLIHYTQGGERLTLKITTIIHQLLDAPIIGFYVKDRLGQVLFGDNTFFHYQHNKPYCPAETCLRAEFSFYMPFLSPGAYSITTSIANGTQEEHEQCHWIHDAITFKAERSNPALGLVGIQMEAVSLQHLPLTSPIANNSQVKSNL